MAKTFWNGQYRHTYTVTFEFVSNKEDASDVSAAAKRRALTQRSLDLEGGGGMSRAGAFHRAFKHISTEKIMIERGLDDGQ